MGTTLCIAVDQNTIIYKPVALTVISFEKKLLNFNNIVASVA
jgi:hypothetical protein